MFPKVSFCLISIYPFFANSSEAKKFEEITDLLIIILSVNSGIRFIKLVHSFIELNNPFNL